jgi:hypothetical protein
MEKVKDQEAFASWVTTIVSEKDDFVARRELLHGIYHQAASDPYLFLRELIQNSYDAVASNKDNTQSSMSMTESVNGDSYVLQIADHVGMDFDTVMGYLLVPEYSSKKGNDIGKFGVGFLSIFRDAEKVVIKTRKDNEAVTVSASPTHDEEGNVIDIEVSYTVDPHETAFQGTVIQKHMKRSKALMQSAYIEDAVIRYGTNIDASIMQIDFSEQKVNQQVDILASKQIPDIGEIHTLSGAAKCVTQGGLYVMDLPEEYEKLVPVGIREMVTGSGFIIDLPKSIPLTRSRNDIASKQHYESAVKKTIPLLAINGFLQRFGRGEVDFGLIPYDYFHNDGVAAGSNRIVDVQALEDARRINSGELIESYSRYAEKTALLELLTVIKAVPYNDEKLSLLDIATRIDQGYYFDNTKLPEKIVGLIAEAKNRKAFVSGQIGQFYQEQQKNQEQQKIINDFSITEQEKENFRAKGFGKYVDFLNLVEAVSYPYTNGPITHTYYYRPDGSLAHASAEGRFKGWNLLSANELIKEFGQSRGSNFQVAYDFWKNLLETSSHEDAHIEAGSDHWSQHHNEIFYDTQRNIIAALIKTLSIRELQSNLPDYSYDHISTKAFLKHIEPALPKN